MDFVKPDLDFVKPDTDFVYSDTDFVKSDTNFVCCSCKRALWIEFSTGPFLCFPSEWLTY